MNIYFHFPSQFKRFNFRRMINIAVDFAKLGLSSTAIAINPETKLPYTKLPDGYSIPISKHGYCLVQIQ
jgi:hypothetical protein